MTKEERANILLGIKLGLLEAADVCKSSSQIKTDNYHFSEAAALDDAADDINDINAADILKHYTWKHDNDELSRILNEASKNVDSWPQWKKDQMRALVDATAP